MHVTILHSGSPVFLLKMVYASDSVASDYNDWTSLRFGVCIDEQITQLKIYFAIGWSSIKKMKNYSERNVREKNKKKKTFALHHYGKKIDRYVEKGNCLF